ncbi:DUF4292 domain-containing protein [Pedobacter sp. JCM 36344]|uniref:DUF4292 domain-containing protein n=1 Tax=Pedobacter sp. JCM 36344 TaxID=3374280 RepID=UPI003978B086
MTGKIKWIVLMAIIGLGACKAKKAVVAPVVIAPVVTPVNNDKALNLKLLKAKDISFNTLAIKAKANLDFAGNKNGVTMNIRMERDKQIWVSITAIIGIEVARAVITPDSIKVRNNLQSTYLKKPFNYAHRYTSKNVNFKMLQAIFAGNTIPDFTTELSEISQQNGAWAINGEEGTLSFKVLFNEIMKVSENNLNDLKSGQALKVAYGSYQQVNDGLFPTSLTINSMAGTKRVNLQMDYTKVDRNIPLDFPFSVPKNYELVN